MNGILGMAQILLMPHLTEAQRLEYAQTILTAGQALLSLLNDMLDLSRVESGRVDLELVPFEVDQLLYELKALFDESARNKSLQIFTHWEGMPLLRYSADRNRLRQMLANFRRRIVRSTVALAEPGLACRSYVVLPYSWAEVWAVRARWVWAHVSGSESVQTSLMRLLNGVFHFRGW